MNISTFILAQQAAEPNIAGAVLFYFLGLMTAIASVCVVVSRNIVRTAVALLFTLISVAGLSVSAVQTLLLELDLAGRIEWSSGQLAALKP